MKTIPPLAVTAGDLRPALTALGRVRKKGKAVPSELQHLKVETVGRSSLRLTATDGKTFLTITLPANQAEAVEPFLVPFDRLQTSLKGARADEAIPIRPLKGPPVDKFPECPVIRSKPIELNPAAVEAFHHAYLCTSQDPTRYVLQGVHLDPRGKGGTRIVGTDGRHLFQSCPHSLPRLKEPIILPALSALASPALKTADTWRLRLGSTATPDEPAFQLRGANWSLTGRQIEGNYPKYQQVIPADSDFKTQITIPPHLGKDLLRILPRLPGSKMSERPLALSVKGKSVSLLARPADSAPCEELVLSIAEIKGDNQTVFLNRDYLSQSLRCGMTRIDIIDETAPVKCTGDSGMLIIMPVRSLGEVTIDHTSTLGDNKSEKIPQKGREIARAPVGPQQGALRSKVDSSRPKQRNPKKIMMKPTQKPTGNPDEKITEIKNALKAAVTGLAELTNCLRISRQQQRQAEKEIQSVKQTLRTLRKVEL